MMNLSKHELLQRVGNISQIAGAQKFSVDEGQGEGTSLIRVRNGAGLDFTIIPDKGFDILDASFKGTQLAWISKNGLVGNQFFNDRGIGWLRSFGGGLLTTCGLRNAGPPCEVNGESFGLHGRFSSIPAKNVCIKEYWEKDIFHIEVSGLIREANTFGENLAVYRVIAVNSAENTIYLTDKIVNEGFSPEFIMLLYHMNWGYPLFSEQSELLLNTDKSEVRDAHQQEEINNWNKFTPPVADFSEVVYFHDLKEDKNGKIGYELKNKDIGIKTTVRWEKKELPILTQWKMTGQGEYVLGLEPCNCKPIGRDKAIADKSIEILDSFKEKTVALAVEITDCS